MNFHAIVRDVLVRFCERGLDVDVGINWLGEGEGQWDRVELEANLEITFAAVFDLAAGGHLSVNSDAQDPDEVSLRLEISGRDRRSQEMIEARAAATGRSAELGPRVALRAPRFGSDDRT